MAKPKGLDKEVVAQIRELYNSDKHTQQELAAMFNLSQSTICKIINNYIHRDTSILMGGEASVRIGYKHGY
jgi:response regulator of citrate/malate metabolism